MLWYHDHAMGINRLNIYAGLLGSYIVRDKVEDELNLPTGKYEIPLVIFDRDFTLDHQLSVSDLRQCRCAVGSGSLRRVDPR